MLGAGRFGVLIPAGANDLSGLQNVQTGCGAHVGVKRSGRGVTQSHLVPRLGMSGAIPLSPIRLCGVDAEEFTFFIWGSVSFSTRTLLHVIS
jgi:hypothetical protein